MSDTAPAAASGAEGAGPAASRPEKPASDKPKAKASKRNERPGIFGRVSLFVRQVVAELRKVVWLTRPDLLRYTGVVLVFVLVVMAFVTVVDLGVGSLVGWVFGG